MPASPTERSLKWCRRQGGFAAVSEHFNTFLGIRQDLFGFVDIVWVCGNRVTFVQTTSDSNVSARVNKIRGIEAARYFSAHGVPIQVHGWKKVGNRWHVRVVDPFANENRSTSQS